MPGDVMFDWPFEFLPLAIAAVALIVARNAFNRTDELRRRLDAIQASAAATAARAVPPPIPPQAETEQAPPLVDEPARQRATMAPAEPSTFDLDAIKAEIAPPPLAPPAPLPADPGLEEQLGTRWVVWIGGLTLALGGFFLVRYSIEAGLVGPHVRIFCGGLFALALLVAGEWTRRKESISDIVALPIANIPAILTAAGTAVAFATVYAAYALYAFLAPASAFILLGLVALGTLAAALLHGPALAGLGVVGAFVTPMLVSSGQPDYWALYIYLAIVTAASFGLARIRLWRWLVVTTIAFALFWTLPCLDCGPSMVASHLFHVVIGFVLAAALVVCGFMFGPTFSEDQIEPISSGSLAAYLFGALAIVLASAHTDAALIVFAFLIAATLFVAWCAPAASAAVAAAAAFVFIVFAEWAVRANTDFLVVPGGAMPGIGPNPVGQSVMLHLVAAAVFATGFGIAGFLAQGRSKNPVIPVLWSASATFVPLALLIALYARIVHFDRSIPFSIMAVILAAVFGGATETLSRRESRPGSMIATALFATGTLGSLALALTFALERGWLTIALALMSMGTAWISMQRPIPFLRSLAAILAAIVVLRIGYEPRIAGQAVGATPIFNWLLWGYGIPAASFWIAGHFMRGNGDDAPLRIVESAAILFTVLLVFMEIRHAIYDGDIYHTVPSLAEFALELCAALAMAIGLERLRLRTNSMVHDIGAVMLTVFAGVVAVFGLLVLENPLITSLHLDGPVINLVLLAYALPAVLMLLLSYAVAARRGAAYANAIAAGALIFALTYLTLEIRRLYHGSIITLGTIGGAEQYTYSIAWLAFGVLLLGIGIIANSERARIASAGVIALTIAKAFLVDMSTLTGVYRALSFICLGLVLVAIGWLYQRILFRRRQAAAPAMPTQPS
jgi:uncharacterized membrane protein